MIPLTPDVHSRFPAAPALLPKAVSDGIVFGTGAVGYGLIEVIWRGTTHWSMLLAGGLCLRLIGAAGRRMEKAPVLYKCIAGGAIITVVEFGIGCICNLWLHMGVWDYSRLPFNLGGQVCLLYSVLWGALSGFAMKLEKALRQRLPVRKRADRKISREKKGAVLTEPA